MEIHQIISIIIISGYFLIGSLIGSDKFKNLKSLLNDEQNQLIKRYIFPYKLISQQQQIISQQQQTIFQQSGTLNAFGFFSLLDFFICLLCLVYLFSQFTGFVILLFCRLVTR